jgi:hypothetical protein
MTESLHVLALLALHLALIGLPVLAAMLGAAHLGLRGTPLLLAVGLAVSGLLALLTFWAFFAAPLLGETVSFLVPGLSLLVIVLVLQGGRVDRGLLAELAVPLGLWALGSGFLLFLGFLHGGTEDPLVISATRFSSPLPTDNILPGYFADWFFEHGHQGPPPPFGDWLSSDRPPLQSGYLLSQHPFGWDRTGLRSEIVGVIVQQLWIVGLWAFLTAGRVGRVGRGLAVAAVLLSGVVIVHGFYAWPKLLPVAFLLAAAALLVSPRWSEYRRDWRFGALVAALISLAFLSHGASAFGVVSLLVFALYAAFPGRRWLAVAVGVGLVLLLPWSAYQKYVDPPGNRLVKWQLAGTMELDDRGTLEAIGEEYRRAGVGGALENKWDNLTTITGNGSTVNRIERAADHLGDGYLAGAVAEVRAVSFLHLLPSLGPLLLGLAALAVGLARGRPRSDELRLATHTWLAVAAGALVWALLMFGNAQSSASVHVGSLLLPVLAIAAAVLSLHAVWPRFAPWYVGAASLLSLALYAPHLTPPPGTSYSAAAAVLAAAALAGFVLVAFGRSDRAHE